MVDQAEWDAVDEVADSPLTAADIIEGWQKVGDEQLKDNWAQEIIQHTLINVLTDTAVDDLLRYLKGRFQWTMGALRNDLKIAKKSNGAEVEEPNTHNDWAKLNIEAWPKKLRTLHDTLWEYDYDRQIWGKADEKEMLREIGDRKGTHCTTRGDYRSILNWTKDRTDYGEPELRHKIAIGDSLFEFDGMQLVESRMTQDTFCRFKIDDELLELDQAPVFRKFLDDTFGGHEDRRSLFQKHLFCAIFGLGNSLQKAFLWQGVTSSGKTTAQRILRRLLPDDLVASIKPTKWGEPYMLAAFADKPVNLAGELDKSRALDETFLEVIGDEATLTARNPYGRVFSFKPMTSHFFNSNMLPNTSADNEAFFRRWSVLPFENRVPEDKIVVRLSEKVELGAVIKFIFDCVKEGEGLKLHEVEGMDEIKKQWKMSTNSSIEFLNDGEAVEITGEETDVIGCSDLYDLYNSWCRRFGIRARVRKSFYADADAASPAGPFRAVRNGRNVFRGIKQAAAQF